MNDYVKALESMTDKQLRSILKSADPMWALAASIVLQTRTQTRAAR